MIFAWFCACKMVVSWVISWGSIRRAVFMYAFVSPVSGILLALTVTVSTTFVWNCSMKTWRLFRCLLLKLLKSVLEHTDTGFRYEKRTISIKCCRKLQELKINCTISVFQITHTFQNYGPGVRYIRFCHGGTDGKYWKGWYGVRITESSVEICPA